MAMIFYSPRLSRRPYAVSRFMCTGVSVMRRMVLPEPGPASSFRLETVPYEENPTLHPGYVRVRVSACAVAYRDIIDRQGGFPFMRRPTVLGHEVAGVVDAVGEGADFSVGDKVVTLHWAQFNGDAFPSPFEHEEAMGTFLGLTRDGGYSDSLTTHSSGLVKVPRPHLWTGIYAAPVMSTHGTVYQGCVVRGQLSEGERVLVTGASGGVGSAAVMLFKAIGAHVIAATGDVENKGEYLKSIGADEVVSSATSFGRSVGPVDMSVECCGAPTFTDSLKALRPGGRLVLIGNVTNSSAPLPLGLCIVRGLTILGTDSIEAETMTELLNLMESRNMRPIVDREMPLEEVADAHRLLEERKVTGRVVLDINSKIW